jgi:3-deoxy-D-manno-octulosonate 8-phosphate phosphatase (KDO 8-P phosphatase)
VIVQARKIRLLVVDVDGVLTDGRVAIDGTGREVRTFSDADRIGIALLRRAGIEVVGLASQRTAARSGYARYLGLTAVATGAGRGHDAIRARCRRRRLGLEAVAYVGHDVLELPLGEAVGLAIAVADGSDQVRRQAHWVTVGRGGGEVMREVAEMVLRAQGKWASAVGEVWRRWD